MQGYDQNRWTENSNGSVGRFASGDYHNSFQNQTRNFEGCSPNFAQQSIPDYRYQISQNVEGPNLYEGYRQYDYTQNHASWNRDESNGRVPSQSDSVYNPLQNQGQSCFQGCSPNFAQQSIPDYRYQISQNVEGPNLYEGYRQYDYTQNHASWNRDESNGRVPSQSDSVYNPLQNQGQSCFQGCSPNFAHQLYPDYRYQISQNVEWKNLNDASKEWSSEGFRHWSHNEQRPNEQQTQVPLKPSIPVLNETQLSSKKAISGSELRVILASSVSEVPEDHSAGLPDTTELVTIQPKDKLGCDNSDMYMMTSDQPAKKLCCPFCQKLYIKLAKHMEVKHSQETDVKKFLKFPKGSKERRAIQDSLRKIGQTNFNKNAALNKKQLIPSRRPNPKHNRKAVDQKTCPYCFGSYAKSGIHFHIKNKCPQKPMNDERTENERVISALTSSVERRYHENANSALQTLFDKCHDDDIVRGVKFDWLAIVYGNKLTSKYNKPRHRKMIQNRMRLIGRILIALKKIQPEVTGLANFLVPEHYDHVVDAIKAVARVDEARNEFIAPATASSAVTAIRQICQMLIVEYIKKKDHENKRIARDFLTVMNSDMHISINKMVNETQSRMARQKTVILPSSDDVKRLAQYLETERTASFNELSQLYVFNNWKRLTELTMASIIVFNRRRVGDTQNILDEDFTCKEVINDDTNEQLLSTLPEHSKQIAKRYSRMKVRGKKNRTVPVLLKANIAKCLELLISHREEAGVSPLNNFLFGLPSKKDIYQVVDAGRVLRKFAIASGTKNPKLLTATNLRKHLATICVTMQLNDTSVADVAEFMGHAEKVHREFYRQNPIERQIVQMSQVLEAAQGNMIVTNQDAIRSGQVDVNNGRKRKLPSANFEGKKNPRRSCKKQTK